MGKQQGPSPEELEHIFRLFLRGLSDSEVLYEMGDTEYPTRPLRFIRDRRREFYAARCILEEAELKEARIAVSTEELSQHREEIKALAKRLMDEMQPPAAFDTFMSPAGSARGHGSLLSWEVRSRNKVHVSLPVEKDQTVETLYRGLMRHLATASMSQTASDIQLWNRHCEHYLEKCYELLREVRSKLARHRKRPLLPENRASPGLSPDFPAAVCIAVIEGPGLFRAPEYEPFQHSDRLFGLRWCSIDIAKAATEAELDTFREMHRQLTDHFTSSTTTAEIAGQRENLDRLQRRIFGHLNRFCHTVPLPGQCDLCQPARSPEDRLA